jgi:hypothetical protein
MATSTHLVFYRGEDVVLSFQLSPQEDITGWTIGFKVADSLGGTIQFTKSATITDGPRARFRVAISSSDTASLAVGRYTWDARRTDSGEKVTLAAGSIDLLREIVA